MLSGHRYLECLLSDVSKRDRQTETERPGETERLRHYVVMSCNNPCILGIQFYTFFRYMGLYICEHQQTLRRLHVIFRKSES